MVGVHDVITPCKFGDDRFRGFWLAKGQSLPFPIDFKSRPYNTHTTVSGVISAQFTSKCTPQPKNKKKINTKTYYFWGLKSFKFIIIKLVTSACYDKQ